MKFFKGDLKNAISKRKTFSSAFIVFIEGKDDKSTRFRQYLDEENTISSMEYVAFLVNPQTHSYQYFQEIYQEVPVPSIFIIGSDGQPILILSSCECKESFYAEIKKAVEKHKADVQTQRRNERLQNLNSVQILLKLPKGETAVVEFLESKTLKEVKNFVKESLIENIPFEMITPFPRKVFTVEDEEKTLLELQLNPTSTILIVILDKNKSWTPQFVTNMTNVIENSMGRMFRNSRDFLSNFIFFRSSS